MVSVVYILCGLTALVCAFLLLQAYRRVRRQLLLWSGICFVGLSISNLLIFVDLILLPDLNLFFWRLGTAVVAMAFLLYGLISEDR
jgi:hypothetical protein